MSLIYGWVLEGRSDPQRQARGISCLLPGCFRGSKGNSRLATGPEVLGDNLIFVQRIQVIEFFLLTCTRIKIRNFKVGLE